MTFRVHPTALRTWPVRIYRQKAADSTAGQRYRLVQIINNSQFGRDSCDGLQLWTGIGLPAAAHLGSLQACNHQCLHVYSIVDANLGLQHDEIALPSIQLGLTAITK
jgi:hypothetical protein